MVSTKLLLFTALLSFMVTSGSAQGGFGNFGLLGPSSPPLQSFDNFVSYVKTEFYSLTPTKDGYHFKSEEPNGSKREEMVTILNPGTDRQETVVMGSYSTYDEKTDTDSVTMYVADKNGNRARYQTKNRKLNIMCLKTCSG
ncbi:uncharacterized protein LOC119563246 [Drosophila subpulchrella]|uniref:uncharacterized protein LOC119563246 n=1 Tax=Drosophila subpulchrella TaxID=1486046 RepID=UPI0018A13ABA|nr:uncharacterized protein LOC119563246 [Drosophila subpulchrella]